MHWFCVNMDQRCRLQNQMSDTVVFDYTDIQYDTKREKNHLRNAPTIFTNILNLVNWTKCKWIFNFEIKKKKRQKKRKSKTNQLWWGLRDNIRQIWTIRQQAFVKLNNLTITQLHCVTCALCHKKERTLANRNTKQRLREKKENE